MEASTRKELFSQLKKLLEGYKDRFSVSDGDGKYALVTTKPITVNNKTQEGIYFAGLRENKNMVGFYFMPIYTDVDLRKEVPASLLPILKGHSCFNVKKLTPEMENDLHKLIALGIKTYTDKGWL